MIEHMPYINLQDIPSKEIIPGYNVRFVHTDNMTFAYWKIRKGEPLPEHSHENEQVANVTKGKFELTLDGETKVLEKGQVAVIPSNAVHSGKAITDCEIIDVFYPVREDYK